MELNISKEIATLQRMTPAQLRERYAEVFGEASRSGNKQFLVKRIAWKLQADAEGGLTQRAMARAAELAEGAHVRLNAPPLKIASSQVSTSSAAPARFIADERIPGVGAVITREYRNQQIEVKVVESGFEFEGEIYRSLSAVARAITGYGTVNGFQFFGLRRSA